MIPVDLETTCLLEGIRLDRELSKNTKGTSSAADNPKSGIVGFHQIALGIDVLCLHNLVRSQAVFAGKGSVTAQRRPAYVADGGNRASAIGVSRQSSLKWSVLY